MRALVAGCFILLLAGCAPKLKPVSPLPDSNFGVDVTIFESRGAFLELLDRTVLKLQAKKVSKQSFPSNDEIARSLLRFRELLTAAKDSEDFARNVREEFVFYHSSGAPAEETLFTGYYKPVLRGSKKPTERFRYALYSMPRTVSNPTRKELEEGKLLRGHELVYLEDPLEAFLAQVQGSVAVELEDGGVMHLAFAGATNYPYVSIGSELLHDGKLAPGEASIADIRRYFAAHPDELQEYLWRNNRFVFFQVSQSEGAVGAFGLTLLDRRSIATDKSVYPAGGLVFYECSEPYQAGPETRSETWAVRKTGRYALDLDTGSAIIGPKRVDLYFGEGASAGELAGRMKSKGNLYYLLLKDGASSKK